MRKASVVVGGFCLQEDTDKPGCQPLRDLLESNATDDGPAGNTSAPSWDAPLATANSAHSSRSPGIGDSWSAAPYGVAGDYFLRRQPSHLFCIALCSPLV